LIAVVGPGGTVDDSLRDAAERVGSLLARAGQVVVTGGLDGVMAAASRGAAAAGGTVVALLPGDDPADANEHAGVVIATGLGQGRNVLVVRSASGVIAVGGSWGTLSEVAIAMRLGKPVVWLHGWDVVGPAASVPVAQTAEEAVDAVVAARA
jgi:uncharacterized protein (TIGR00725 family)